MTPMISALVEPPGTVHVSDFATAIRRTLLPIVLALTYDHNLAPAHQSDSLDLVEDLILAAWVSDSCPPIVQC